jgi:response regulator RpfG family c-di-GMP phosphodiesterase
MALKTLIIDDDPVVVLMLQILTQQIKLDSESQSFENGLLALQYLNTQYNKEDVYFIFLDIHMPVMNAWEFLLELTHFADPKNTFVCIVTSSTDMSDELKATQNPLVSEYLIKPIYKENLLEFIKLSSKKYKNYPESEDG